MESAGAALERLCDPEAEVSAHYLIARDGRLWQLVDEDMRAWHAGAGQWRGMGDINSRSIGIELDNRGPEPFAEPQMAVLEDLLRGVMARWGIAPAAVIAHSDMAPGRKADPGPHFDWARLARQGLAAVTPAPAARAPRDVQAALVAAGYPAEATDADRLAAFRLRHRPWATGPVQEEEARVIAALAAGLDPPGSA